VEQSTRITLLVPVAIDAVPHVVPVHDPLRWGALGPPHEIYREQALVARDADRESRRKVAAIDLASVGIRVGALAQILDVAIVSRFRATPGRLEHPGFGALLTGEFRDDVRDDLPFLCHAMPAGPRFLRTPVEKVAVLVPPPLVRDGPAPETRAAPHLGEVEHLGIAAQKLSLSCDPHQLLALGSIFDVA